MRTADEIANWYYGDNVDCDSLISFEQLVKSVREEAIDETVKACAEAVIARVGGMGYKSVIFSVSEQLKAKL